MPGLRADWRAISLCLLAASTFWFFNAMNDDHTADISYPIEFIYDQEKFVPVEELPEKVRLNASGYGWNLLRKTLRLNRTPVTVDLQELNSTKFVTASELLPILKAQLDDIRVNYVLQDTLYLQFDRVITREFPVRVDTTDINLAEDHRVTSKITVEPKTIKVTGPSSYIKGLSKDSFFVKVPDETIDSDYEEEIETEFNLAPLARVEPDEVTVSFQVDHFEEESLELKPVLRNFPADTSLVPDVEEIEVTFLLKEENLAQLRHDRPEVILDLKRMQPDSTIKPVLRRKPAYVKEYQFEPSSVRVKRR